MKYTARLENGKDIHRIALHAGENEHTINIAPRDTGFGSSVTGGELLFLAIATCYCNDLYREAAKKNIKVESVEVDVEGDFPAAGEPARNIVYKAKVKADASEQEIRDLMKFTDTVTEIQNSLRMETPVILTTIEAVKI